MIKKLLFLWAFIFVWLGCFSQQAFQLNTYAGGPWWFSGTGRPVQGENGSNYFFSKFTAGVNIAKTTPTGFVLWNMLLTDTNTTYNKFQFSNYHDDLMGVTVKGDTIYIVRFDSDGNELWNKHLVKSTDFRFRKFLISENMNIIIAGEIISGNVPQSISVIVCDSLGNFQFGKNYTDIVPIGFRSLNLADDYGFIITGYNAPTQFIFRTDASGNVIWNHRYTNANNSFNVFDAVEGNGGAIFASGRLDLSSTVSRPYVIRYNSAGIVDWLHYYIYDQDPDEGDHLLKWSNGTMCLVTSVPYQSSFIFRRMYFYMDGFGAALNQEWLAYFSAVEAANECETQDGGMLQSLFQNNQFSTTVSFIKSHPNYNVCPAITPNPNTPVVLNNYTTVAGNITASAYNVINHNSQFSPVMHLTPFPITQVCGNTGVGLIETSTPEIPSIIPNPAKDIISISNSNFNNLLRIDIYDSLGKLIQTTNNINSGDYISIESLSGGIYFYILYHDGKSFEKGKLLVTE